MTLADKSSMREAEQLPQQQREVFNRLVADGQSPSIALICAAKAVPLGMTDDVAMAGVGTLDQQIKDRTGLDYITKQAMKHGYKPKPTDQYVSTAARFPGDPRAFVNHGQGRGDLKRHIEENMGTEAHGLVNTKAREPEDDPNATVTHQLNPNIVNQRVNQMIKENPDLARKDRGELVADIKAKHGSDKPEAKPKPKRRRKK